MGAALLVMLGPTVVFGLFALLALRFGAESRPGFDGRPVRDDRPNWPAIPRVPAARPDDGVARPGGAVPVPPPAPAASRGGGGTEVRRPAAGFG